MTTKLQRAALMTDHPWDKHRLYEEGPPENPTEPGLFCVLCGQYIADPTAPDVDVYA